MKATLQDLRRHTTKILEAIDRKETITLSRRGKEIAYIVPKESASELETGGSIRDEPAFGMWADREDMRDPTEYVRSLRRGRYRDL